MGKTIKHEYITAKSGQQVCISTVNLGYVYEPHERAETYVFPAENGQITDWGELDGKRTSLDKAIEQHNAMVREWAHPVALDEWLSKQ